MLVGFKSYECSLCKNKNFEIIEITDFAYWLRCKKCTLEKIIKKNDSTLNPIDLESLKESEIKIQLLEKENIKKAIEEKRKRQNTEKEKLERKKIERENLLKRENEKKIAASQLRILFQEDYLHAEKKWADNLSKILSKKEFLETAQNYVCDWFKTKDNILNGEQARAIAEIWNNVQVVARAGSGKTRTIVNRAYFLIKHCGVSSAEILLLAFNKKAAEEMTSRMTSLFGESAPQAMTFHALAYSIVHPEENLILDNQEGEMSKSNVFQSVVDSYLHSPGAIEKVKGLMLNYFRSDWETIIEDGYHLSPKEMLKYRRMIPKMGLDGKVYKSKGEKRIADYLFERDIPYYYEKNFWWEKINYKPDFTIDCFDGVKKGIVIEYFGMAGDAEYDQQSQQKKEYWEQNSDYYFIPLYPNNVESIEKISEGLDLKLKSNGFKIKKLSEEEIWNRIGSSLILDFTKTIKSFIELCRKKNFQYQDLDNCIKYYKLSNLERDFLDIAKKIYEDYLNKIEMEGQEDFDGLMFRAVERLNAGNSKWDRKAGSGNVNHLKYIFIDEYQDFTYQFNELIQTIISINKNIKLFCVGDDWQAINGFAGSELRYFNNFTEIFMDAKELLLTSNYRSAKKIVSISNKLMKNDGEPAKAISLDEGQVKLVYIDKFTPSIVEKEKYGDTITPALIRIVNYYVEKNRRVALLCRRNNGIPYFLNINFRNVPFRQKMINEIRNAIKKEKRHLVIDINTVHSFKGKEEDVIVVVDAVETSYPLIHPSNLFFRILGRDIKTIIAEEKRLFYVALSRAKESLVVVTESDSKSIFLKDLESEITDELDLQKIAVPNNENSRLVISITNTLGSKGTFEIKELIKQSRYSYNSDLRRWEKTIHKNMFSLEGLKNESWFSMANNVKVTISDEFKKTLLVIDIKNGEVIERPC